MRWGGIKNGALLKLIEREGFNVFLTGDKNMAKQQRLESRPVCGADYVCCQLACDPTAYSWNLCRP